MSKNLKICAALVVAAVVALLAVASFGGDDTKVATTSGVAASEQLVPPDSQRLEDPPDSQATFVEFLDLECEACRAAFPAVEQLRETYGDRVTFVVRYMPLHANSENAARAAEAAAEQGRFDDMYARLFETQPEWGEQQSSQEEFFFGLAEELGLDMERFRTVYDDPATLERIRRDEADGRALGVTGTPTFFLDGEKLTIAGYDDLVQQIELAVGQS